jgi:hypothetical protein
MIHQIVDSSVIVRRRPIRSKQWCLGVSFRPRNVLSELSEALEGSTEAAAVHSVMVGDIGVWRASASSWISVVVFAAQWVLRLGLSSKVFIGERLPPEGFACGRLGNA